mgnify:CR=1 FL=1
MKQLLDRRFKMETLGFEVGFVTGDEWIHALDASTGITETTSSLSGESFVAEKPKLGLEGVFPLHYDVA